MPTTQEPTTQRQAVDQQPGTANPRRTRLSNGVLRGDQARRALIRTQQRNAERRLGGK